MNHIYHFIPDKTWSLFLDRDGVINKRIVDEYVTQVAHFQWLEGVKESLADLSRIFGPVVVVTNQQGIGKGLMTEDDLTHIHQHMLSEIQAAGGRIDKVYYCPALKEANSFDRKPSVGMGLKARRDFPHMRHKKSVMVGDSITDMEFGKRLGMITVFITNDISLVRKHNELIDFSFESLQQFNLFLQEKLQQA